ncbi:MAG: permease [Candidatus Syntropharchaeia archaeon]
MIDTISHALMSGFENVLEYLSQHVLTCLVPAFFIAGAIAAFVKKDAILKYFGPTVKKSVSYPLASISGAVLAVCSCTILPLFAGIYKKGSGIGPATAFLYSGPAINILAIVYTAKVLGYDLGVARAVAAVTMSIVIGLLMATIFKYHDETNLRDNNNSPVLAQSDTNKKTRSIRVSLTFFVFMIAILVIGASKLDWVPKLAIIYVFTIGIAYILIYYFKKIEVTEWGYEAWNLAKKIFPILIAGTFIVGVIAYFLPPETFRPYLGGNSVGANFLAAIIGAILYMPTLLEVPIIGTTFGYTSGMMGGGPALALLLAGPAVSLPNMIVLYRIVGSRKMITYISLVVAISTLAGFVYGNVVS